MDGKTRGENGRSSLNPPVNPNVLFTYEDYLSLGYDDERRYEVREYWIVDPRSCTVEQSVYEVDGLKPAGIIPEGGALTSRVVDGFTLELSTLFRPFI